MKPYGQAKCRDPVRGRQGAVFGGGQTKGATAKARREARGVVADGLDAWDSAPTDYMDGDDLFRLGVSEDEYMWWVDWLLAHDPGRLEWDELFTNKGLLP